MPIPGWKTVIFNVLALVILLANPFGFADFQADPELGAYATAVMGIVNLILRIVTKSPVFKKPE
jgi:hypothetical protein